MKKITYKAIQETVTPKWLSSKMSEHGVSRSDLKERLGITNQCLSEIMNNTPKRPNKAARVTLYLFFEFAITQSIDNHIDNL